MEYYKMYPTGLTEWNPIWLGEGYMESIFKNNGIVTHMIKKDNLSVPIVEIIYNYHTEQFQDIFIDYRVDNREVILRTNNGVTYAIRCLNDWEISSTNRDMSGIDEGQRAINIYDHIMTTLGTISGDPTRIVLNTLNIP